MSFVNKKTKKILFFFVQIIISMGAVLSQLQSSSSVVNPIINNNNDLTNNLGHPLEDEETTDSEDESEDEETTASEDESEDKKTEPTKNPYKLKKRVEKSNVIVKEEQIQLFKEPLKKRLEDRKKILAEEKDLDKLLKESIKRKAILLKQQKEYAIQKIVEKMILDKKDIENFVDKIFLFRDIVDVNRFLNLIFKLDEQTQQNNNSESIFFLYNSILEVLNVSKLTVDYMTNLVKKKYPMLQDRKQTFVNFPLIRDYLFSNQKKFIEKIFALLEKGSTESIANCILKNEVYYIKNLFDSSFESAKKTIIQDFLLKELEVLSQEQKAELETQKTELLDKEAETQKKLEKTEQQLNDKILELKQKETTIADQSRNIYTLNFHNYILQSVNKTIQTELDKRRKELDDRISNLEKKEKEISQREKELEIEKEKNESLVNQTVIAKFNKKKREVSNSILFIEENLEKLYKQELSEKAKALSEKAELENKLQIQTAEAERQLKEEQAALEDKHQKALEGVKAETEKKLKDQAAAEAEAKQKLEEAQKKLENQATKITDQEKALEAEKAKALSEKAEEYRKALEAEQNKYKKELSDEKRLKEAAESQLKETLNKQEAELLDKKTEIEKQLNNQSLTEAQKFQLQSQLEDTKNQIKHHKDMNNIAYDSINRKTHVIEKLQSKHNEKPQLQKNKNNTILPLVSGLFAGIAGWFGRGSLQKNNGKNIDNNNSDSITELNKTAKEEILFKDQYKANIKKRAETQNNQNELQNSVVNYDSTGRSINKKIIPVKINLTKDVQQKRSNIQFKNDQYGIPAA
jgi:hypothetical protein